MKIAVRTSPWWDGTGLGGGRAARGVGKALIAAVLAHPAVRDVRRLALVTDDAHGLYEQFGFRPLDDVRKWMQRRG